MHIYGISKDRTNHPTAKDSKGDTDIKNRLLDTVGEGEGRVIWKNSTETFILPYVKQMTNTSWMHEAVHPKPVL